MTPHESFDLRIFLVQVLKNPSINRQRWEAVYKPIVIKAAMVAGLVAADDNQALTITERGRERVS